MVAHATFSLKDDIFKGMYKCTQGMGNLRLSAEEHQQTES